MTSSFMKSDEFVDIDQEDPASYCPGGYHPVLIGDIFNGRYTAIRKLGWGHFSTVWLCSDRQFTKNDVALKVVKSEERFAKFAREEIKVLKWTEKDKEPLRIVKLLDSFEIIGINGTHICLAMEVLGDNLLQLIIRSNYNGIPLPNVKTIAKQTLEGLDFLHTKCGLIHTDIKPENILLCALPKGISDPACYICNLQIKIGDLGTARWVDNHKNEKIQTCEYRCPEVIIRAGYGPPADIWSTACLLFELATGDYLFQPESQKNYSMTEDHLSQMQKLLGAMPKQFALSGKHSHRYFDKNGRLTSISKIKRCNLFQTLRKYAFNVENIINFAQFLLPMLVYNPENRMSAKDCLSLPWLSM